MNQSLKSPSADSPEVQGGAGILGCAEIATGFFILHSSLPIKSSKNPTIPVPSREDLQNSILCLLPPGAGVEGVQRKVLQGSSQQRTFHGLVLWELLLGIQCHPQGHPKLLAGSVPSPHARSSQAGPPNPCVHAGAGSAGREHNSMASVSQQGHPEPGPYTNSVKSSTEEISLFLCPVS